MSRFPFIFFALYFVNMELCQTDLFYCIVAIVAEVDPLKPGLIRGANKI